MRVGFLLRPGRRWPAASLAVLPFINLSQDRDQEFPADDMTEDLITGLAANRHLSVVWAGQYDRPYAEMFEVQDDVVAGIAGALNAQLSSAEHDRARGPSTSRGSASSGPTRAPGTQASRARYPGSDPWAACPPRRPIVLAYYAFR